MEEKKATGVELLQGIELHPEHESWARLSTQSTLVGFGVLIALIALLVILVELRGNPAAMVTVLILAALLVLGLLWRNARAHGAKLGVLDDAGLTVKIKAALSTDLDLSNVNVDTSKGVVTLRGTVPYANFRGAAEQLALRAGAHRVVNALTVSESAPKPPPAVPEDIPGVTTPEGAPVAAEANLETLVRDALEADKRVRSHLIFVRVEEGIAYLTGRQETTGASEAATEIAAHVPGILGVVNDLEILPSY